MAKRYSHVIGYIAVLRLQNIILEMVAKGETLKSTADRLCVEVERLVPGTVCSVLTTDRAGLLHPLSGPSLPDFYSAALDGLAIGPNVGSCGTAAFLRTPIAVIDIDTDPRWADYKHLPLPLGLKSCWSSPIVGSQGQMLGTFAFYFRECRGPTRTEQKIVETLDADQKRRWDELVGPSVPGELNFPLPPPDAEN